MTIVASPPAPASTDCGLQPLDPRATPDVGLPVAVIGAGPVGLAAAAHLLERGLEPVVFEAGDSVGAAVRDWGHVPMFSPWRFNVDRSAQRLLECHGWVRPDDEAFPTGADLADRYLDPMAATPDIASRLRLATRVTGIARMRAGKVRTAGRAELPFEIRTVDRKGHEQRHFARAVIDASGTWMSPNPAGASGLPALGERAAARRIRYGMPDVLGADRGRYAGRRVVVLGSGHSATGSLLDLAALASQAAGTTIVWALRRTDLAKVYGGGTADQLSQRAELGTRLQALVAAGAFEVVSPFDLDEIRFGPTGNLVLSGYLKGMRQMIEADEMVVATGLRPDLSILGELRTDLDPALDCPKALAPLIDPNVHSCGTVRPHGAAELMQPEPGLFIVGMKAYGRAPTFLLATGYEQVRSVVAHLAGDAEAAGRVELVLPETGICSGPATALATSAGCCGAEGIIGTSEPKTSACCTPRSAADNVTDGRCCDALPVVSEDPVAASASSGCCGPQATVSGS